MKKFLDKDFLLSTEAAKELFHKYAEKKPILDYHCHINPEEIAKDRQFENISQLWLGSDHYKWRQMRSCGVEEKYITGNASDSEKFQKWAETLEKAIGNPLYHWSHLELRRYFGYEGVLNGETAKEVWTICNEKLREKSMSARSMIKQSSVTLICTTDDPVDNLEWHKKIKEEESFDVQVLPTWRPDRALNIEKPGFKDYIARFSEVSGVNITSFKTMKEAFRKRLGFFISSGCRTTDHAPEYIMYVPSYDKEVETIFDKRLSGVALSKEEELKYKTAFMLFAGGEYSKNDLVMELHYGCKRNNNTLVFDKLGPDTGHDCIDNFAPGAQLSNFLDALDSAGQLPRTIIYSLNPNDNAVIGTILGCFQDSSALSKIQQGAAWWFNDHKPGITEQLTSLANLGILSNFVGMLTDSRSFLSYTRHEYFRRILCDLIGSWVENGEYPYDVKILSKIVSDISYDNAVRYFKFKL
ncbi:uronate isomerase [Endomicrobiia bacterium]|uniref:glucuronate isomerase n=1 Tax=Endomicrobium trichonymphae TaxID=1408204 RepID=UPI00221B5775|nr:uronate isomerase [Endomicrobiia bacterium]GHT17871.1 uronate isomerase [Endomicrobiia bacterium]GMO53642.1 MAG: glucuronate isomerase [Candidatus Endomicrobium trichonymphae]